jgi:hypothetical protein
MRIHTITTASTLALAGAALLPASALAADPALFGMDRVHVTVEAPESLARYGLTRQSLEAAVREALGPHADAAGDTKDIAHLHVDLNPSTLFHSWGVRLEVERAIPIEGQPGAYTRKVVWSDGQMGGILMPQEARNLIPVARELAERLNRGLSQRETAAVTGIR